MLPTDKKYCVYCHTLKLDNRKYIGITCKEKPEYRWGKGKRYKNNQYFTNTINKYGWDSFEHEILLMGLTKEEACLKEQELIKKFNTNNQKFGFNLTSGGERTSHLDKRCADVIKTHHTKVYIPKDELYDLYVTQNKTMREICKHYGLTCKTFNPIRRLVKEYGIVKEFKHLNITEENLTYQYIELDKSIRQCAKYFECGSSTIFDYLTKYNIKKC